MKDAELAAVRKLQLRGTNGFIRIQVNAFETGFFQHITCFFQLYPYL